MAKTVEINEEECVGCETCVELCPDIFGFNEDDEKAYVILADSSDADCIEEAMGSCPAECISYE